MREDGQLPGCSSQICLLPSTAYNITVRIDPKLDAFVDQKLFQLPQRRDAHPDYVFLSRTLHEKTHEQEGLSKLFVVAFVSESR